MGNTNSINTERQDSFAVEFSPNHKQSDKKQHHKPLTSSKDTKHVKKKKHHSKIRSEEHYISSNKSIDNNTDRNHLQVVETEETMRTPEREVKSTSFHLESSPADTLQTFDERLSPSYHDGDDDNNNDNDDLSEDSCDYSFVDRNLTDDFDVDKETDISIHLKPNHDTGDLLNGDILSEYMKDESEEILLSHELEEEDDADEEDEKDDDESKSYSNHDNDDENNSHSSEQDDDFLTFDSDIDEVAAKVNELNESSSHINDGESIASDSSMFSHDDEKDDESAEHSISEISLGQKSSSSLFFQRKTGDSVGGEGDEYALYSPSHTKRPNLRDSMSLLPPKSISARSIIRPAKPTASNAFETLPRHLINTGLIRQAVTTLRDERFLERRITKLGAVYASKVHVFDLECLHKKIIQDAEKLEDEFSGLEASLPSSSTFADGDNFESVSRESLELFEKIVLESCGIVAIPESPNEDENCIEEELTKSVSHSHTIDKVQRRIELTDGGRALYTIGKFLEKMEWNDNAMILYRHALYLYFLDLDIDELRLLDDADDCDGYFYVQAARSGTHTVPTITHRYLGTIFTKMGDVHEKLGEKNNALRAYRASQVFWKHFLENTTLTHPGESASDEEFENYYDHIAAVEAFALSYNRIGSVYTAKGDLDSALASFHEALDVQIKALGEEHVQVAKTIHNVAVCHRHIGDWNEALNFYKRAYDIFEKVLGRDHLDSVRTLHNIGGIYRRQKEFEKAMECFVEVLDVRRRFLGDDHPSVAITLVSMAAVLRRSGRKKEAQKFYSAAVHL
jgi:tetratricopeptide (TPR) repeat protein